MLRPILILTLFALSTSASALTNKQKALFAELDSNGDGFVSLEEKRPSVERVLKKRGKDVAKAEGNTQRFIAKKDQDGDGQLSLVEYFARPASLAGL